MFIDFVQKKSGKLIIFFIPYSFESNTEEYLEKKITENKKQCGIEQLELKRLFRNIEKFISTAKIDDGHENNVVYILENDDSTKFLLLHC